MMAAPLDAKDGAKAAPKNILVVMADQLTPMALGCYGGPGLTPHMDRLVGDHSAVSTRNSRIHVSRH